MQKYKHYEQVTFFYDTEEEKRQHSEEMQKQGYIVTGRPYFHISLEEIHICGEYIRCSDPTTKADLLMMIDWLYWRIVKGSSMKINPSLLERSIAMIKRWFLVASEQPEENKEEIEELRFILDILEERK